MGRDVLATRRSFTRDEGLAIATELGIGYEALGCDVEQFRMGLDVEQYARRRQHGPAGY